MDNRVWLVGIIMIATAACSSGEAEGQSTTRPTASSTSSTTSTTSTSSRTTTTTSIIEEECELPISQTRATPEALDDCGTYVRQWTETVRLSLGPSWNHVGSSFIISLSTAEPSPAEARILLVNKPIQDVEDLITQHETVIDRSPAQPTTWGGRDATLFDATITGGSLRQRSCAGPILVTNPDMRDREIALPGCATTRIWLIAIGEDTVVAAIADASIWSRQPATVPSDLPGLEDINEVVRWFEERVTIEG